MGTRTLARHGRVAVRKFRRADLKERIAWPPYVDPFFVHLNYSLKGFVERERWILARTANAGRIYFAIEDEAGRLIGEMSLRDINTIDRTSRLGIHMASNKVGQGYGGEAVAALLEHYFMTMRYEIMYLDVGAWNVRALKVYERLNFEHIPPFWRRVYLEASVLDNPDNAPLRRFFRGRGITLEGLYYDMELTKARYEETLGSDGRSLREG